MGYVVDYKRMQFLYQESMTAQTSWIDTLTNLYEKVNNLSVSDSYEGTLADSMKLYAKEIHLTACGLLQNIIADYVMKLTLYWNEYIGSIDEGLEAHIEEDTLTNVQTRVNQACQNLLDIADDIPDKLDPIKDIFTVNIPSTQDLECMMEAVKKIAVDLNTNIDNLETAHKMDFQDMDTLIDQLKVLLENQLSNTKNLGIATYQANMVSTIIDVAAINTATQNIANYQQQNEDAFIEALSRQEEYAERLQESREWIEWVAVGVAVVGSVALIFVTAGAAAPLVCVTVGAAAGLTSAAVGDMADNYVQNGYLAVGMDWAEFGKDCMVATVAGGISGYYGAVAQGTSVVQPLQKAGTKVAEGVIENAAEGAIDLIWDVGDAVIRDRPGEEIKSIVADDLESTLKKTASSAATDFVTGYLGGVHDANADDKSALKKAGEKIEENAFGTVIGSAIETGFTIGEGFIEGKDSNEIESELEDIKNKMATDTVKGVVGGFIDGVTDNAIDKIDNPLKKSLVSGVETTISSGSSDFASGLMRQTLEGNGYDLKDIWETDMEGGTSAVEAGVTEAAKTGINESDWAKQGKFKKQMEYYDKDKDGKIETVNIGRYRVAKEEYDAAQKLAGTPGYEGKTAEEILGAHDYVTPKRQYTLDIENLEKSKAEYKGEHTNVVKIKTK